MVKSLRVIFLARENQPQIGVGYGQPINVPDFFLELEALAMVFKGPVIVALALIDYPEVIVKNGSAVRVPVFYSYVQALLEVLGGAGIIVPMASARRTSAMA